MTTPAETLVAQQVADIKTFLETKQAQHIIPLQEEQQRLAAQVKEILVNQREIRRISLANDLESKGIPRVPFGKYQGLSPLDLAIASSLLRSQPKDKDGSPGYAQMIENWGHNLKAAMDSTTGAAGDELVDRKQAAELWMDVNLETAIASLVSRITMPSNPFDVPLQLGDVNWYPGTENVATKSTTPSTARQALTAYELVADVPWSLTLEEDSVIAMMEEVRQTLVRNAAEIIDDLLLNADTTTVNNINADGATVAATDAGKGHWLLGFDGIIHLPLVDNTAQTNNHAAAPSDAMFNKLRTLMAKYAVRPSDAVFVTDIATFLASQTIANLRTIDKFGPQATILTGQLAAVEGIPLIVSEQMVKAQATGLVSNTAANNTTGRLLCFNRSQWRMGFRRELTIETTRDVQKRQNIMVVSFRIALQERSGTRSTATHSALQRNITGV